MPLFRIVLALLVAAATAILTATPALAHTVLKSSTPADGATLDTAPDMVTLTFEEAVNLPANPVSITGPDGAWAVGAVTTSGASVMAPVQASGPAGRYTLRYTVIADDGDAVTGTVAFTLTTAAAPATPSPDAASPDAASTDPAGAAVAGAPASDGAAAPDTAAPATAAAAEGSDSGTSAWAWLAVAIVVAGVVGGLAVATRRRRSGRGTGPGASSAP